MISLSFHETHRYAFPATSANVYPPTLSPTALTCAMVSGDPYLVFLTQTQYSDEFIWLHLGFDQIMGRVPTPPGRDTTSGLGYDKAGGRLICSAATTDATEAYVVDPATGAEVAMRDLSADSVFGGLYNAQGTATNGQIFAQAGRTSTVLDASGNPVPQSTIQMRTYDGALVADRQYDNREFTGICKSAMSWTLTDTAQNEIVVLGPFGNTIATAPGLGTAGGMQAIAFDNVRNMGSVPQLAEPPGALGPVGTLLHPDTPWDPAPWLGRHKLYVANVADQTIYSGFLIPA